MSNSENAIAVTLPTSIRVLMPTGEVEEMKVETYLAGAVAAGMDVDAPLEALKAQAVAARTYVASARRHEEYNADICTTAHCQKWRRIDPVNAPEVFRALSETWGMVAVHDGNLINAFFFEHCDGHTRNSEDMLMPAVPYLRGVDCSCGFLMLKGHGVGMCKRGAIVMARRGASFQQILQHYYRGIAILNTAREAQVVPEVLAPTVEPAKEKPRRRTKKAKEPPAAPAKPVKSEYAKVAPRGEPRLAIRAAKPVHVAPKPVHAAPPLVERKPSPIEPIKPAPPPMPTATHAPVPITSAAQASISTPLEALTPIQPAAPSSTPTTLEVRVPKERVEPAPTLMEPAGQAPSPALEERKPAERTTLAADERATQAIETVEAVAQTVTQPSVPGGASAETTAAAPMQKAIAEADLPALEEMPAREVRRLLVDCLPGQRMIAGCLARAGIVVAIEDTRGNKTLVFSGSAAHYGEGGFETIVDEDGLYHVSIDGEVLEVQVQGETVFIHAA